MLRDDMNGMQGCTLGACARPLPDVHEAQSLSVENSAASMVACQNDAIAGIVRHATHTKGKFGIDTKKTVRSGFRGFTILTATCSTERSGWCTLLKYLFAVPISG